MQLFHEEIGRYFDTKVDSFDGIYTGKKSLGGRLWDKATRKNIQERSQYALNRCFPIEGKRFLDAGCGPGRYCIEFARRGAAFVLGVDSSREMIRKADAILAACDGRFLCEFRCMNILDLRETFDYTCALGFFDYVCEPASVLAFLRTITVEKIIASFPAASAFRSPARRLWYAMHRVPTSFYSASTITEMVTKAGFVLKECKKSGPLYLVEAV